MSLRHDRSPTAAVLEALLVTFLWSTSWVLIKLGLVRLPALPFAGLRYALALLVLLPLLGRTGWGALRGLERRAWGRLALLGLLLYTLTQGAQFAALALLPAATVGMVLAFTPLIVALAAWASLDERPSRGQASGVLLCLAGAALYLWPPRGLAWAGLAVAGLGLVANAAAAVLGRAVNRDGSLAPLPVTVASMGVGAPLLLLGGVAAQGAPRLGLLDWAIVLWLAVVNTAFAFTLWNRTLQRLQAVESSIINNTMLVQIALLAWVCLGERLSGRQVAGLAAVTAGAVVVQLAAARRTEL